MSRLQDPRKTANAPRRRRAKVGGTSYIRRFHSGRRLPILPGCPLQSPHRRFEPYRI